MDLKTPYLVKEKMGYVSPAYELEHSLFSPASLDISSEEWKQLVQIDVHLAAHIGCMLLERYKDLNMLITTTEACAEEQTFRANYYEKQLKHLREAFDAQSKIYETFELQVESLTQNYRKIQEECLQYKRRNKELWKSIEKLEQTCDDYLEEMTVLKRKTQTNEQSETFLRLPTNTQESDDAEEVPVENINFESLLKSDDSNIISLRVFAEETSRKLELEKAQRLTLENRLNKTIIENKDLQSQVHWLEYRLVHDDFDDEVDYEQKQTSKKMKSKSLYNLLSIDEEDKTTNESSATDLDVPIKHAINSTVYLNAPTISTDFKNDILESSEKNSESTRLHSNKIQFDNKRKTSAALTSYQQMFAEIFEKLKFSREKIGK